MRHLACVAVLALAAAIPASGQKIEPLHKHFVEGKPGSVPYVAPSADGPVVELLDEGAEPLFQHLFNEGGNDPPVITREDRDVFAGVEATRVTPVQKYQSHMPGWNFRIVEKPAARPGPKAPAEYRYLRFAWKKLGGKGIAFQLYNPAATKSMIPFFAGENVMGWQPATQITAKLPTEWTLVTVDLFRQFGEMSITGMALSPCDGDAALFDHVLLGRTVEDLDHASGEALGKNKPAKPLAGKQRDPLWADLNGLDAKKAAPALRAFLASAPEQVAYIRDRLADVPDKDHVARVRKLITQLDADGFDDREQAMDELIRVGPSVIDTVREAGRVAAHDELRYRCRVILKKLGSGEEANALGKSARLARAVRVLEQAGNSEARAVLAEIAQGKLAPEAASDAKAALARMPKK